MHLSSCRQRKCHAMLVLQPTVQGRSLCAPRFQVGFGHSFLGTDCNRTTISRGHETGSTLSAVSIYGHRFSAFWLRSSVVSVLSSESSEYFFVCCYRVFSPPSCFRVFMLFVYVFSGRKEEDFQCFSDCF